MQGSSAGRRLTLVSGVARQLRDAAPKPKAITGAVITYTTVCKFGKLWQLHKFSFHGGRAQEQACADDGTLIARARLPRMRLSSSTSVGSWLFSAYADGDQSPAQCTLYSQPLQHMALRTAGAGGYRKQDSARLISCTFMACKRNKFDLLNRSNLCPARLREVTAHQGQQR